MAKLMLVINPISGTGSKKGVREMVEKAMAECGHEVDVRLTGARGDATRLAREATAKAITVYLPAAATGPSTRPPAHSAAPGQPWESSPPDRATVWLAICISRWIFRQH